jgi:hypothetical protein
MGISQGPGLLGGGTYEKRNKNVGWESLGTVYDLTGRFVFKHTGLQTK